MGLEEHLIARILWLVSRAQITLGSLVLLVLRKAGLSSKHPYRVMMKGEPLWWTGADGEIEEIGGFFTTRWVMASSDDEAAAHAVRIVEREVEEFVRNPPPSPLCVEVEECVRLKAS